MVHNDRRSELSPVYRSAQGISNHKIRAHSSVPLNRRPHSREKNRRSLSLCIRWMHCALVLSHTEEIIGPIRRITRQSVAGCLRPRSPPPDRGERPGFPHTHAPVKPLEFGTEAVGVPGQAEPRRAPRAGGAPRRDLYPADGGRLSLLSARTPPLSATGCRSGPAAGCQTDHSPVLSHCHGPHVLLFG